MGKNIAHVGPSGSGNKMKLINQMLVGITQCAVAEAMVLAVKIGLESTQTYNILSNSFGDSAILRRSIPNFVLKRDFTPAFTLNLLNKDMKLLSQLAQNYNVRMIIGNLAQQVCLEGSLAGYGDQDMSAVIQVLENLSGIKVVGAQ
jgi:3-hydroxyisobutyrate dehydrogenase-like beta-hydroxyacid dehydrogenase